jgi:hypothetical protein
MILFLFFCKQWNAEEEAIAGLKNLRPQPMRIVTDRIINVKSFEGINPRWVFTVTRNELEVFFIGGMA